MSQRILNLTEIGQARAIPASVQTGVKHDRSVRFRATDDGQWCFELRRRHGTTFAGPYKTLPLCMQRAERVSIALADTKIAP